MEQKQKLTKHHVMEFQPERLSEQYPIKILQFGDGNFIRAFVDWLISELNQQTAFNGKAASIQTLPTDNTIPKLKRQDGLYTVVLQGIENDQTVNRQYLIDSLEKWLNPYTEWKNVLKMAEEPQVEFLFSNTTEAGIQYKKESYHPDKSPVSYPGKVTALLYHRFQHFQGDKKKGFIVIPCELIENNGDKLKSICTTIASDWQLPASFMEWLEDACAFCNTLVDRIVPGYPKNKDNEIFKDLPYTDELLTVAEPYHLFVIEGPDYIQDKLPFHKTDLNVQFDEIDSYREMKVKLLNAPHTILASIGMLSDCKTVRNGMENSTLFNYINQTIVEEISKTLQVKDTEDINKYIQEVYNRFANPFLDHYLSSISLNSYAKYITRVWPIMEDYEHKYGEYPRRLVFSFATLLVYFKAGIGAKQYQVNDSSETIQKMEEFFSTFEGTKEALTDFIASLLREDFLQENKTKRQWLSAAVADYFLLIQEDGIEEALVCMNEGGRQ